MNKIVIYGNFWDSYLYSNNLILFDCNNDISVFDWEELVNCKISDNAENYLAYNWLFLNGDYLYNSRFENLFKDNDIKYTLIKKFKKAKKIELGFEDILQYRKYDKFSLEVLPTDIGIYNNTLYYINSNGLFCRKLSKKNKRFISKRCIKHWDGRSQCLKIGPSNRIALSAQDQGLFEYNNSWFGREENYKTDCPNIYHLISEPSQFCDWCYSSILSSSLNRNFHVVRYKYNSQYDENIERSKNF